MTIRSYRDLEVWQLAMQLAHAAYDSPISSLRSSDMYCCRRFAGRHSRCQAISLRGEVASTRAIFSTSYPRREAQYSSWRRIFTLPISGTI